MRLLNRVLGGRGREQVHTIRREGRMRSLVVTVLAVVVPSGNAVGQSPKQTSVLEQKIRALEQAQVDLLLRKDIAALRLGARLCCQ